MKLLISLSAFFLLTAFAIQAQNTPLYLIYTRDCVHQLEYRYTYNNNTVVGYSVQPSLNEQFLLTAGIQGITSSTLPKGAVNCTQFTMNESFTDAVNRNTRQVYMVHQTSSGYLMMPIIAATQISRYGSVYQYKAPYYSFAVDTSNLVYGQNIALPGTQAYIYFTGHKMINCRAEYAFRREPTQQGAERSDFEFIPGIGITANRTGLTAMEAENNQYRLVKFDGLALEDYLNSICPNSANSAPVSKWTPEVSNRPITEPDKETSSLPQTITGNTPAGPPGALASCPVAPSFGYHIVQPSESLLRIARTYGTDAKTLMKWNKIVNPDKIEICTQLQVLPTADINRYNASKGNISYKYPAPVTTGPSTTPQYLYWSAPAATEPAVYNYTPPAPAAYNTLNNTTPLPTPTTTVPATTNTNTPLIHVVQRGETLSGLARRYGYTEERFRQINGFPATGDITIYAGQPLYASECNLPGSNVNSFPATNISNPANDTRPAEYNSNYNTPTPAPAYDNPNIFREEPVGGGVEYKGGNWGNQPGSAGNINNPAPAPAQYNSTTPSPAPMNNNVTSFQEYVVIQGETINSIAYKLKVNPRELALANGLEVNETLIGGQKLLVPRQ